MKYPKTYLKFERKKDKLTLIAVSTKIKEKYLRKHLTNCSINFLKLKNELDKKGSYKLQMEKDYAFWIFCVRISKKELKNIFKSCIQEKEKINGIFEGFSYNEEDFSILFKRDKSYLPPYIPIQRHFFDYINYFDEPSPLIDTSTEQLQELMNRVRSLGTKVYIGSQSLDNFKEASPCRVISVEDSLDSIKEDEEKWKDYVEGNKQQSGMGLNISSTFRSPEDQIKISKETLSQHIFGIGRKRIGASAILETLKQRTFKEL